MARYLARRAVRVQYSVFLAAFPPKTLQQVLGDLALLIDPREDDLRCYPLARQSAMVTLGRTMLPEEVVLVSALQPPR